MGCSKQVAVRAEVQGSTDMIDAIMYRMQILNNNLIKMKKMNFKVGRFYKSKAEGDSTFMEVIALQGDYRAECKGFLHGEFATFEVLAKCFGSWEEMHVPEIGSKMVIGGDEMELIAFLPNVLRPFIYRPAGMTYLKSIPPSMVVKPATIIYENSIGEVFTDEDLNADVYFWNYESEDVHKRSLSDIGSEYYGRSGNGSEIFKSLKSLLTHVVLSL